MKGTRKDSLKALLIVGAAISAAILPGCRGSELPLEPDPAAEAQPFTSEPLAAHESPIRVVTVEFRAVVTSIADSTAILGGSVVVGDTVSGSFKYDENARDHHRREDIGNYLFRGYPFEMHVHCAGLEFRSNPDAPNGSIRIENDCKKGVIQDSYRVKSNSNLDVLPGVGVHKIQVSLVDQTASALSSDDLLRVDPMRLEWPTAHFLTIIGINGWVIGADLLSGSGRSSVVVEPDGHGNTKVRPNI